MSELSTTTLDSAFSPQEAAFLRAVAAGIYFSIRGAMVASCARCGGDLSFNHSTCLPENLQTSLRLHIDQV